MTVSRNRFPAAAAVSVVLASVLTAAQQSPRELFQQALALERAQGSCQRALPLYERVARDAASDRPLAARALVQMAGCQERMGQSADARATWQRVVRDFNDQPDAVATARARLAASQRPPAATAAAPGDLLPLTRARDPRPTPVSLWAGIVSPDGRYVASGNIRDEGRWASPYANLIVRDLQTGEVRILDGNRLNWSGEKPGDLLRADATPPGPPAGGRDPNAVRIWEWTWSPDSRQLVYSKLYLGDGPPVDGEIRLINIDGSGGRILVPKASSSDLNLKPVAWSPDGRTIALFNWIEESHHELVLLTPVDGSMRTVKSIPDDETYWCLGEPAFSPDGRFLALGHGNRDALCDISLLALDGSGEQVVVKHPANDELVGWTGGGDLLFTSDRSGTTDLWMVSVAEGRAQGLPQRLASDLGRVMPVGLTRSGDLYYQTPGLQRGPNGGCCDMGATVNDVYVASLDPATGDLVTPPAPVSATNHGRNHSPSWSPNGRHLVYRTRDVRSKVWTGVTLLSMETGEERHVRPAVLPGLRQMAPWLAADGQSLFVASAGPDGALFRVNVDNGQATRLGPLQTEFTPLRSGNAVAVKSGDQRSIALRDLNTFEERTVYQAPEGGRVHGVAISADDTQVAFQERTGNQVRFMVASIADGTARAIGTLPSISRTGQHIAWSADGRFLYYAVRPDMRTDKDELWRIPTAGGAPVRLLAVDGPIWNIDVHPSGRYIAFASEHIDAPSEFVLKDFLPAAPRGGGR